MLGIILTAGTAAFASARQDETAAAAQSPAAARKADPAEEPPGAQGPAGFDEAEVPVKVYVAGTPEDPYIVARIGDFPKDLGELGKEFFKREFIEHFIRDVMGLGAGARTQALKIALLPQEDAREQECSFSLGEVSGRITVRLAARQVFVLVSLDDERTTVPTLRASLVR